MAKANLVDEPYYKIQLKAELRMICEKLTWQELYRSG